MRIAWSIPLLLATAAMAFPAASADPGHECAEENALGKYVDDGTLQLNLRRDCSLEVVAFEGIVCVGGWGGVVERDVDRHTVRAYYCTGGAVPDIASAAMPGCKRSTHEVRDDVQGVQHTVEVHHNCRIDLTLNEGITCVGAWTAKDTHVVGPITIENHRCTMPGGDPALAAASIGVPVDPCPITRTPAPVDAFVDVEMDKNPCLDTQVTIGRALSCTEPLAGTTHVDVDRVAVDVPGCGLGSTTQARAADPCNGIWYAQGRETLATGTTVSYGTNLQPGCTHVRAEHGAVDCTADLSPDCEDIWINWMACLWGGSYKTVKAGLFNVHVYTCDNRPPDAIQSQAAADPLPGQTCGIVYQEHAVGPVTVGHSLPCFGVSIDYEWSHLPDDATLRDDEGGIELCATDPFGTSTCKVAASWTCLGGAAPKQYHVQGGLQVNHCVPGPNPGPAI